MALRYILDSDVIIWVLRGHAPTRGLLREIRQEEPLACSAVTEFEVWAGLRDHEMRTAEEFLDRLHLIPLDKPIARKAGEYWREFRRQGVTLGFADVIIAATARIHDLSLVTYNRADFPMPDITLFEPMPTI